MSGDQTVRAESPTGTCTPEAAARVPLRTRVRQIRRAFRQMFGIPDFDRYVEHMQLRHPGEPVLSERKFYAMAIDRRYGAARPRCC